MIMAHKSNRKLFIFSLIISIIAVTFACNLPTASKGSNAKDPSLPGIQISEGTAQTINSDQNTARVDNNTGCIAGVIPGKTIKEEVLALLGEPVGRQEQGNYETLLYTSPIKGLYNSIYLLTNTVELISIIPEERNLLPWSKVKAQFGEPAYIGYSNYEQGSRYFAYPEQGLNFLANDNLDTFFFQECFVQMSLENYMDVYGKYHPQEDLFIR